MNKLKKKKEKKDGIVACLAVSNTALKVRYCKIHQNYTLT